MMRLTDGTKRLLKPNEIECRVGQKNKDGSKYSVLLYKTARTDMAILDEVFGWENWQSEHYQVKDKDFCRLSVRLSDGSWISKSDCGDETNVEARKGESSDAMKRAGTQFGIGRELYTAPSIWLSKNIKDRSLQVDDVRYDEFDRISYLSITGYEDGEREKDRKEVYSFGTRGNSFGNGRSVCSEPEKKEEKKEEEGKTPLSDEDRREIHELADKLEFEGKDINQILDYYHVEDVEDVPLKLWRAMLAKVRRDT